MPPQFSTKGPSDKKKAQWRFHCICIGFLRGTYGSKCERAGATSFVRQQQPGRCGACVCGCRVARACRVTQIEIWVGRVLSAHAAVGINAGPPTHFV